MWGGADGAAVVGGRDFPKLSVRISGVNDAGMADGNVAVDLAVDEQNRRVGFGDRDFGRRLAKIQAVPEASIEEAGPNGRDREYSADLWRKWKPGRNAVSRDTFEA